MTSNGTQVTDQADEFESPEMSQIKFDLQDHHQQFSIL